MRPLLKKMGHKSGIALILTILIMSLILFLSLYLMSFSLTEDKISRSQLSGDNTYYLAEAGIQEMVWKLNNDTNYKNSFETNPAWTQNFTRNNPFGSGSDSYAVTITNSSDAHGEIVSTGAVTLGNGKTSQRIIKTNVYRALGQSVLGQTAGYGDHDIVITNSNVHYISGNIYANHDVTVNGNSTVTVDQDINAIHQYTKAFASTVTVGGAIHAGNYPPPPSNISMPAIDFDSNSPNSYKNKANVIYSESQFADLLQANQTLILNNDITYVDHDVNIPGGQRLIINGLLVINHDFTIGADNCWEAQEGDHNGGNICGFASTTVNQINGKPSGILVKHKIEINQYTGDLNVTGVLYTSQDFTINNLPQNYDFNVNGSILSGHTLSINSTTRAINITFNNSALSNIFGSSGYSPVISVEHWEEEY